MGERGTPNWDNRTLFHGDNLDFLRGMDSETVHLIATDPPFKKGRDFYSTPDSLDGKTVGFKDRWRWDNDVHEEWADQVKNSEAPIWFVIDAARHIYGDDMAAFLCWLGVRLMEMRRVLREDGQIYLHIDHTAHAYVKALMDSIFGAHNFQNEIVWCYRGGGVPKKAFARKHDSILRYSVSKNFTFHKQYVPYSEASTALVESRGGVSIDNKDRDLDRGASMPDWWTDINSLQTWSPERTQYQTQKPIALYERIVVSSSNPGDIVLDPFCGCATTPVVAERTQRQWVGIDIWDDAYKMVLNRLAKEGLAVHEGTDNPNRLITFGDVILQTEPPIRTDDNETAAPILRLRNRRMDEPWQKLTDRVIRAILVESQSREPDLVDCAGCGRQLESQFMELDHVKPVSEGGEDFITNRVLLCSPCNRRKSNGWTLTGLRKNNEKDKWMINITRAKDASANAIAVAKHIQDDWTSAEVQEMVRKADRLSKAQSV